MTGNLTNIRRALGLSASFAVELTDARNFAAHRCEQTRKDLDSRALARGQPNLADLSAVMLALGRNGHGTVTAEWLTEIETSMTILCA